MHGATRRAIEELGELFAVAQRSDHAKFGRRMRIVENLKSLRFDGGHRAPDLRKANEEQLMVGQVDAGQRKLRLVVGHPLFVSLW